MVHSLVQSQFHAGHQCSQYYSWVIFGCSVLEQDLTGDGVVATLGDHKVLVILSEVHSSFYNPHATAPPLGHIACTAKLRMY